MPVFPLERTSSSLVSPSYTAAAATAAPEKQEWFLKKQERISFHYYSFLKGNFLLKKKVFPSNILFKKNYFALDSS